MPIRREIDHVNAKLLECPGVVFCNQRPVKPMVEPNQQRFEAELLDYIPRLERAVLAAGEGNDAVIESLAAVLIEEPLKILAPYGPVDLVVPVLNLAAHAAHALLVE